MFRNGNEDDVFRNRNEDDCVIYFFLIVVMIPIVS